MSKKAVVLACVVGLSLAGGGCGPLNGKYSGGAAAETSASSSALRLDVRSERGGMAVMEENIIRLALRDEAGNPVEQARIEAYLVMPGMFCGRIPAEARAVGPGQYELLAIPVMAGKWEAEISVASDGDSLRAAHPFKAM
ncbi:FixH family protein [Cohnella cellulosilytica]|uniref:FixH family protein n=1 Tax=Cohnella cellulosilytica TaxID=986710 RepID=A0ABW2FB24_9BACL